MIRIEHSENPLDKYTYTVTLNDNAEITILESLSTSQNIFSNIFKNLPADDAIKNKTDCDCTTVCAFCICTPQDCDCDCF